MKERGIAQTAHTQSALLAIYSNGQKRVPAENLFWRGFATLGLPRTPYAYELMFKLYDSLEDYDSAHLVYRQMSVDQIKKLPYEGWRALIRSAALYAIVGCSEFPF
jgi:hypothetical protein